MSDENFNNRHIDSIVVKYGTLNIQKSFWD